MRRELRRSVEDRLSGIHPDSLSNLNNDSAIEIKNRQIRLLEQEKEEANNLCELSRQTIIKLEERIEELENPLKPHIMRLDMQTKQVNIFHYVIFY